VPPPDVPVAEGEERDTLRERLRWLAKTELQATEVAWEPFFVEYDRPTTTTDREPTGMDERLQRKLESLRRQEDSYSGC
jgi:hypothetical protein